MSKRHNTGIGQMDRTQTGGGGNIKTISRFAWLECWRASVRNMPCRFQALSFADWQTAIHVSNNLPTGKPGSACFVLRSMSSCAINSLFRLWWVFWVYVWFCCNSPSNWARRPRPIPGPFVYRHFQLCNLRNRRSRCTCSHRNKRCSQRRLSKSRIDLLWPVH